MNLFTIYLDFDGTVVEHAYPELGAINPRSFAVIRSVFRLTSALRQALGSPGSAQALNPLSTS